MNFVEMVQNALFVLQTRSLGPGRPRTQYTAKDGLPLLIFSSIS